MIEKVELQGLPQTAFLDVTHIHQPCCLLNFMYFYLKKSCYININCLLSLVQTGSRFHILSLQWFVLNVTKYYRNENVTIVFLINCYISPVCG